MRCDIVIKTWRDDLCWLSYCLKFLHKNWLATGSRTIILADEDCRAIIDSWQLSEEEVFYMKPWGDGYSHAMVTKALADEYTEADLILLVDSDTMFTKPVELESLMEGDRPIIRFTDYNSFEREYPHAPWRRVVEKLFLTRPAFYYTFLPAIYWRSSFQGMRRHLARLHHRNFLDLTFSNVLFNPKNFGTHPISFADHESLGFYCHLAELDRYAFKRFVAGQWAKCYHSWTEWNEKTQAELENLLAKT